MMTTVVLLLFAVERRTEESSDASRTQLAAARAPVPRAVQGKEPKVIVPAVLKVERLDDQALMELLDGMPMALVDYPDGKQQLLMIAGR